jgi:excisionase family DNA binding protein
MLDYDDHVAANDADAIILLTPDEAAAVLKVSVRTLWRMRSAGEVPEPVRLRNSVRWRKIDLARWLAAGCPARDSRDNGLRRAK